MKSKKMKSIQKEKIKKKDSRFQHAEYDPKFKPTSAKTMKTKINPKFKKMMTDPQFGMSTKTDKYGRKQPIEQHMNHQLEQYYSFDQEQNEDNQIVEDQQNQQPISKWMEEYAEESSDQSLEDIQYEDLLDQQEGGWQRENVIKNGKVEVTKRLALCNYDWMHISAKDLMILFSSFKPNTGFILKITVYYSDFGKIRMQEEEEYGPQQLWEGQQPVESEPSEKKKKSWRQLLTSQEDNHKFHENKLRAYEKQRLKYCYAVIQCDSPKTADEIYRECDGNQFQNSNLEFDLRYIPDDLSFNAQNIKEVCKETPRAGEVKNFINRASGHSKVSLTWEDPELTNIAKLKNTNWNNLNQEQMEKIDWQMYLNQEQMDHEQQYQSLMEKPQQKVKQNDWRGQFNKKKEKEDELQITFGSGFDNKLQTTKSEGLSLKKQIKSRKQRIQQKKQEKKRKRQEVNNREKLQLLVDHQEQAQFKYNPEDTRFRAVFQNPAYSIDPVNPQFDHRKTGEVFAQVVKRNRNKHK